MLQLRANTKSLTCPPLSTARYSFIQLSQLGCQWRERKCPIFEMVEKRDSNPDSLDCESGILPLSHRAPLVSLVHLFNANHRRDEFSHMESLPHKDSTCAFILFVYCCLSFPSDTVKHSNLCTAHSCFQSCPSPRVIESTTSYTFPV